MNDTAALVAASGGRRAFGPAALGASAVRWYDAIASASLAALADANPIPSITDLSPAGVAGTNAGGARPIYKPTAFPGGLPCWRTAGAVQWFDAGTLALTTYCALAVGKWSNAGVIFEHSANLLGDTDGSWCYTSNGGPSAYVKRGGTAAGRDAAAGWASSGVAQVVCATYDGTNAGTLLYANSLTPLSTSASGGSGDLGAASSGAKALGIGANTGGTRGLNGDWFAFLLVTPKPSDAVVAKLISYYARRAGLTLS